MIQRAHLISVIMAIGDGAQTIDRAIDSLAGQDYTEWELLAVDDGMNRTSRERLESWMGRDSRIRTASPERFAGRFAALNVGIRQSQGSTVAYLDCACELQPNYLERIAHGAERVSGDHPERVSGTHPLLEDSRFGQERQVGFMPTFDPSWISSTRESDSSRHSSRKCGSGGSAGPEALRSFARPGRSGPSR
jgi:glycosyltransferase involved in cell wall biosynthesis